MFIYLVTNWYQCVPSSTSASPGNPTGGMDFSIDCSVAKIEVHSFGCDTVVPTEILVSRRSNLKHRWTRTASHVLLWGFRKQQVPDSWFLWEEQLAEHFNPPGSQRCHLHQIKSNQLMDSNSFADKCIILAYISKQIDLYFYKYLAFGSKITWRQQCSTVQKLRQRIW